MKSVLGSVSVAIAAYVAVIVGGFCAGMLYLQTGCASAHTGQHVLSEVRLRSQLDVFREVIEPASKLASAACIEQQEQAAAAATDGAITVATARTIVAETRARCDRLKTVFDEMRELHDLAATGLESGAIQATEARVRELHDAWKRLDRGGGSP